MGPLAEFSMMFCFCYFCLLNLCLDCANLAVYQINLDCSWVPGLRRSQQPTLQFSLGKIASSSPSRLLDLRCGISRWHLTALCSLSESEDDVTLRAAVLRAFGTFGPVQVSISRGQNRHHSLPVAFCSYLVSHQLVKENAVVLSKRQC